MRIAFLSSAITLPNSPIRRLDGYEHDYQLNALRPHCTAYGIDLHEIAWDDPKANWLDYDAAILGTPWDYQEKAAQFLSHLRDIEAKGIALFNPTSLVEWNIEKTYLKDLENWGAPVIKTLWYDRLTNEHISAAFEKLGSEDLVFKRIIGAGAVGQFRLKAGAPIPDYQDNRAYMVQPFLPAITEEGEYSFIMIDGEISHTLTKHPAKEDYRIQSLYGGIERTVIPTEKDMASARNVMDILCTQKLKTHPLYARVDMVRDTEGMLRLMELELIEPYLYPEQGTNMGKLYASALAKRLGI